MKKVFVFIVAFISLSVSLGLCGCFPSSEDPDNPPTSPAKVWEIAYYVDEFNNPTNEAYIKNSRYFVGTFSNSATTNSELNAIVLIDKNRTAIRLWEYGWSEVKGYSKTTYNITYLDSSGNRTYSTGTLNANSDRIVLSDSKLITLIQQNPSLRVYIEENSQYGYNTTYLFTITRDNFNTIYNQYI